MLNSHLIWVLCIIQAMQRAWKHKAVWLTDLDPLQIQAYNHAYAGRGYVQSVNFKWWKVSIQFVHNNTRVILFKYFILTTSIALELLLEDVIKSRLTMAHREVWHWKKLWRRNLRDFNRFTLELERHRGNLSGGEISASLPLHACYLFPWPMGRRDFYLHLFPFLLWCVSVPYLLSILIPYVCYVSK